MFVFYDWPFPHVYLAKKMQPISLLILGSVFSDCVIFYGDTIFILLTTWRCWEYIRQAASH